MTQTITGGSVTFGRTVKTGDYETKRLDVTLNFSAPEGGSADVGAITDQAIDLVHEKLDLKKSAPAPVSQGVQSQPPAPASMPSAPAAATPPKRSAAPPKKPPVIDVKLTDDDKASIANISLTPEDRKDPANPADVTQLEEPHDEHAKAAVEGKDPTALDDFAAIAPDITEADILSACGKKAQATGNPIAVKQLIGKYVSPPKGAKDIPQELRQKFLDELAKL